MEKAIEVLAQRVTELESQLEESRQQCEQYTDLHSYYWTRHTQLPEVQSLPVPRLEIELIANEDAAYSGTHRWEYRLVYRHLLGDVIGVPLGSTSTTGPLERAEPGDTPFRDGVHIRHDAQHLRLPAFSVVRGRVKALSGPRGENGEGDTGGA